ncbi:hypothetical protein QWZ13_11035 [Reinekea marina]|uniref:hypothetical protein n=1 Tax=Reinekea marina TaxID=1310421 RepID=UPI0025B3071A|nr:hypothetical protein [Reinekea marina]MDN3649447.1 hypothetical protein [Reinekea marina]
MVVHISVNQIIFILTLNLVEPALFLIFLKLVLKVITMTFTAIYLILWAIPLAYQSTTITMVR